MKRLMVMLAIAMAGSLTFAEEDIIAELENLAETSKVAQVAFTTLPLCRHVEGTVEVMVPGGEWASAEEGRFYPLGTHYRTGKHSKFIISFGTGSTAMIDDDSEFATRVHPLGEKVRTLVPIKGRIDFKLADNLPEGVFFVSAPGFSVKNPAGSFVVDYKNVGDGDVASIRCVTGSIGVEGRHFNIPMMSAANEVLIRTSRDHLVSTIVGVVGSYPLILDQGNRIEEDINDQGEVVHESKKVDLEVKLSPKTKIVISRAVPAIGQRMSVHTLVFDQTGVRKSECSFCEGRAELNSGELVPQNQMSDEERAKRAEEVAKQADELVKDKNNSNENAEQGNEEE